ncbi:MAG TPA: protein kinase, partial [Actinoplanes sp.]|nr:protein kinase [Actinoplanes sp.]
MSEPTELGPRDPRAVGPYRLVRKLGAGGQGTVFLGTDGGDEPAAVKVLSTDFQDAVRLKRVLNRELASAQSVAAFVTAQVIAFDLDADPPYIATEFVDGPTLEAEVRDGRGPLRGSRLADVAIQTVIALEAIHAANVIHCDFKPGNIMLGPGGVKVIDFGIARAWESVNQAASRVIGSAHFMAPEQVDNQPLGPPVDMFSWGSVMVFAATGRYAFPGSNPVAVGVKVVQDEPDLHGLTGPLAELVRACLHKDPARRPTAAEVRQALMAPAREAGARPLPAQPVQARPLPARSLPSQPHPAQPLQAQPLPAQPHPARPFAEPPDPTGPFAEPPDPADPLPPTRRGRFRRVLVAVLVLALAGAGTGWAWRQWDLGGVVTDQPSTPPDAYVLALQDFARPRPLDDCTPLTPNERQLARRSCSADGAVATYSLYKKTPLDER